MIYWAADRACGGAPTGLRRKPAGVLWLTCCGPTPAIAGDPASLNNPAIGLLIHFSVNCLDFAILDAVVAIYSSAMANHQIKVMYSDYDGTTLWYYLS